MKITENMSVVIFKSPRSYTNYIIKDENMAAVLDIFSKYDIIKNK